MITDGMLDGINQLKCLSLGNNQLKTVSRATFNPLSRLKKLYLNINHLDKIPDDTFDGLTRLK